ncbi:c-type cytochrome [Tatlockia sp. PL877]|nr:MULTISPECIES: c-type cytochrome [unclassified Legionella]MDI9819569.1 c-type cytochrome [Legionella sp. PL877]
MRFGLFMLLIIGSLGAYASEDFDRQQIQQRIKPIGKVRLEGEQTVSPGVEAPKEEVAAKEEIPGKAVYDRSCAVCHRDGVAGAPKFRVLSDWKSRLEEKKLEGLTASAIKGINAMPPKGTCMDCSDEDIKEAVQYMLPEA